MISVYNEFESDFEHIGIPLPDVISASAIEEANGMFELELEYPRDKVKELEEENIIKCSTYRGEQLFRIYKVTKTLRGVMIYARHITYDLLDNFIEDVRPTGTTGINAIQVILNNTQYPHPFIGFSDISNISTAYYIRKNPIQCLIGDEENSFVNRWGGEIVRDNFNIRMMAQGGTDRGYDIRLGKNLIGIEEDIDTTEVVTRLYPTVVINQVVYNLPEKYIDSHLIDKYRSPIIRETRVDLPKEYEDDEEINMAEVYQIMREHCKNLYEKGKIDEPQVNYKVDFVELSKTEQYKNLGILEQINLYDIVHINVSELDINIDAKVIKVEYDVLKDKYEKLELGSFKNKLTDNSNKMKEYIDNEVEALNGNLQKTIEVVTDRITGNLGGYKIDRYDASGKPYETLYMDTDNINTAKEVIRINKEGVGFSTTGYNGPFRTAITAKDGVIADYITAGILNAGLIKSGLFESADGSVYINMSNGKIDIGKNIKFTENSIRVNHDDGSYSMMDKNGIMMFDSGIGRKYHHRTKIIKFVCGGDGQAPTTRWIPIGSEFNGLDWEASLAMSDSMDATSIEGTLHRIVLTQTPGENVRYRNGQWEVPVMGYTTYYSHKTDSRRYSDMAGIMIVTA